MDLDGILDHFFGPGDPDDLSDAEFDLAIEKMKIAFGTEPDPSRKFALWTMLEGFDAAPLPAEAFAKEPGLKAAAEEYLKAAYRIEQRGEDDA